MDAYGAVWFFTTNQEFFSHNQFFPGTQTQSESPVVAFEGHLSYDFKSRLWVSLDANFWHGGETSLGRATNPVTVQKDSRIGVTAAIPITKHLARTSITEVIIRTFPSPGNAPGWAGQNESHNQRPEAQLVGG